MSNKSFRPTPAAALTVAILLLVAAMIAVVIAIVVSDNERVQRTETSAVLTEAQREEVFLLVLKDSGSASLNDMAVVLPDEAVGIGKEMCRAFDQGVTMVDFFKMSTERDFPWTPEETGRVLGAAVGTFCPEHEGKLQ